jgi:hypothetical protein
MHLTQHCHQKETPMSLDYIMVGNNDLAQLRFFHDAVMAQIGGCAMSDMSATPMAPR